jgi:phospholipid-binding lipoprotein MlaA
MMTALRPLLFLLMLLPGLSAWCQEVDNTTDPWESMNRRIFAFNDTLDKYALLPAARGYQFIMPDPAEEGVGNFISNIYEFNSVFNFLLQGRPGDALQSAGRFLVNTTMGLAGLLDVATPMGIAHEPADFGQTLYTWGVDRGPYVVLPIFGPRTVRSATGYFVDTYTSLPSFAVERQWAYLFWVVEALDLRVDLMQAENLLSGDRYIFVRNAYLQRREYFLTGEIQDSFSIEEEGDEYIEF